jgi:endo-1,4-beta-xylanase
MSGQLIDQAWSRLFLTHFEQLTPEWEMKMEYILKDDGSFRFDAPDRLAAFARSAGVRLYGHTLIWYSQARAPFVRIDGGGRSFADSYRNYILAVAGRYRGRVVAWDVVNEPVDEDGEGLRDCIWSRNLGQVDYIRRAFEHAREADPGAVLFLNDYNLELKPRKRLTFLRLAERLLESGAPLGGLATQSHLYVDSPPGALSEAVRDLARLGLPVHISELDVQQKPGFSTILADPRGRVQRQARLYAEAGEALMSLPARQRFGLTVWGLRDGDHWLVRDGKAKDAAPCLFDADGRPKPALTALQAALRPR